MLNLMPIYGFHHSRNNSIYLFSPTTLHLHRHYFLIYTLQNSFFPRSSTLPRITFSYTCPAPRRCLAPKRHYVYLSLLVRHEAIAQHRVQPCRALIIESVERETLSIWRARNNNFPGTRKSPRDDAQRIHHRGAAPELGATTKSNVQHACMDTRRGCAGG